MGGHKKSRHRLIVVGSETDLRGQEWRCSCGAWFRHIPGKAYLGSQAPELRVALVRMEHDMHRKSRNVAPTIPRQFVPPELEREPTNGSNGRK